MRGPQSSQTSQASKRVIEQQPRSVQIKDPSSSGTKVPSSSEKESRGNNVTINNARESQHQESRLAKVKRVLLGRAGPSSGGSTSINNGNSFGIDLEVVRLHNEYGIPWIVYRLCSFIENSRGFDNPALFKLASASSKLADKLRASFEKRGDADLEATGCPATAALLLRQYLKELPKALVNSTCVSKLLQLHSRKYTITHV